MYSHYDALLSVFELVPVIGVQEEEVTLGIAFHDLCSDTILIQRYVQTP